MARSAAADSKLSLPIVGDIVAGKYRIEKVLGEGGMGTVLAAYHTMLEQHVALKMLAPSVAEDEDNRTRFYNEARLARKIRSEHVVRIDDVAFTPDGVPFIVMEYLQGIDLADLLVKCGPLPVHEACDYALQALDAIGHAHAQGIIHRDLKPSNLFLTETETGERVLKILDFGISKATFHHSGKVGSLTSSGAVLGSPFYMSPEQVRSTRTVDARSDIWSLGVVLYELLTGKLPFVGDEMGEIFAAILEQEPVPLRNVRPDLPEALERVIMKCLERNKERRYANVAELAVSIAPFGTGRYTRLLEKINSSMAWGEQSSGKAPAASVAPAPLSSSPYLAATAPVPPTSRGAILARTDLDPQNTPDVVPTASTVARHRKSSSRVVWVTLGLAGVFGVGFGAIYALSRGHSRAPSDVGRDPATTSFASTVPAPLPAPVDSTPAEATASPLASATATGPPVAVASAAPVKPGKRPGRGGTAARAGGATAPPPSATTAQPAATPAPSPTIAIPDFLKRQDRN